MSPERSRIAGVLGVLLLGGSVLLISLLAPDPEGFEARPLKAGDSVSGELRGGERHLYRFSIEPGQAFRVILDPRREDFILTLFDPFRSGQLLIDTRNGFRGPEILYMVADLPGHHLLEIHSQAPREAIGSYELMLEVPRPVSKGARLRAAATSAFSQGEAFFGVSDEEAAGWYRRALELWEEAGDLDRAAATRFRLGRALQDHGDWELAREVFQPALLDVRSRGDILAEASLLDRIGRSHFNEGRLDDAAQLFEQSRDLFKQERYGPGEADTLGGLGLVYKRRGDFQASLNLAFQALDIYKALKRREDQALLWQYIGELHFGLGEHQFALDSFESAEEIGRTLESPKFLASALGGQGTARAQLGQLELASSLLQRSVELWQQAGDRKWEVVSRIRLADVHTRALRFRDARAQYEKALVLARAARDRRGEAMALGNLGHLFDLVNLERQALRCFGEAQSIFQELDDLDAAAKVLKGRAEAALDLGDIEAARSAAERGVEIVETLRSPLPSAFSDRRELYNLFIESLMQLHEKAPERQLDRMAFNVAEKARSRSFLDEMKEERQVGLSSEDSSFRESELGRQLRELDNKRSSLPDGPSWDSARADIDRRARDLETRLKVMRADSKGDGRVKALTLEEIQSGLGEDTVLLFYFLGGTRNLLWEVTRDRFVTHRLSLPGGFEKTAEGVRDLLAMSPPVNPRAWASRVEKLSHSLLGPLAGRLKERQILISPDGALHLLPFAAMLDPDTLGRRGRPGEGPDSPQFLILKHQILIVPSISMVAASRAVQAGRTPAPRLVAMLTDPVFDRRDERAPAHARSVTKFDRLPYTEQEGEAIRRVAPPGQSFLASGFLANRSTATSPELGLYNYLHFATHAELRERPDLSGIVLSLLDEQGRKQDGFLRAFEIYDLNLSSDLVVLSACETALGSEKGGLVRAFLHAGSKRVLATLWKVPDRSTSLLMESFYQELLRQGLPPDAALQRAQIAMLESPRWKAPHYWAGFVLQGEWQ
ncbi:MAG TPA: CHAT domain-containing tetratricopeptide repeat protein [Thermoanaerobaculia bacterium]|nr:CHAT domain-containing tetratricopeptide repeat protein [Thermoanaerobaculia bacterium]